MKPDDEGEFEELLQRAYRYALSLCHDRTQAEDLVQEGCLRIAKRGGPWDLPYLMRVVRNAFIDRRRREAIVTVEPIEGQREPASSQAVATGDVSDELARALGRLSTGEREALYLSAVEERSAADIARLTGRPRGTILSLLYRGKEKLRQMLESGGVSI
jgi:RNA polymerase sigma-70 factor (ECF subfamily)